MLLTSYIAWLALKVFLGFIAAFPQIYEKIKYNFIEVHKNLEI